MSFNAQTPNPACATLEVGCTAGVQAMTSMETLHAGFPIAIRSAFLTLVR